VCKGSQGAEHAVPRPPVTNGHAKLIGIPQRLHSVVSNYVSHVSWLLDCHELWDKADGILHTYPRELASTFTYLHSLLAPAANASALHAVSHVINSYRRWTVLCHRFILIKMLLMTLTTQKFGLSIYFRLLICMTFSYVQNMSI